MPRYFLELSYKGTHYNGWQIQDNAISVQQKINEALAVKLGTGSSPVPLETVGCGRTDTGVHATQFFAHFDASEKITDTKDFVYRLNALLPFDISIHNIHAVADDAHARYDAVQRSYRYYIHTFKNSFLRDYSGCYFSKFNLEAMNEVAQLFMQHTDFSSFCKARAQSKTPYCKIYTAQWKSKNGLFIFEITADRFLRGMVRAMVGTMIDVGAGKTTLQDVEKILAHKDRTKAGHAAPACGLYLTKIVYPYLEVKSEFNFPFTL
jgi:tRNA pseudouridine38-40 synthase